MKARAYTKDSAARAESARLHPHTSGYAGHNGMPLPRGRVHHIHLDALAKQIPAGLGFSIWSTLLDNGCCGYTMQSRFSAKPQTREAAKEWAELNARWFQFGTFVPLLRLHGELQPREPWTSRSVQDNRQVRPIALRLMPYIYSVAGAVTHGADTMMRPLVMDFPGDAIACKVMDNICLARLLVRQSASIKYAADVYLPATQLV